MKDITTGALRRRRGGTGGDDFDLSESEDERIEARRRAKRREFTKMRKALLADDKLSKMADDPKKAAFLRSIEDRDYVDENDFLADEHEKDNIIDVDGFQQNNDSGQNASAAPAPAAAVAAAAAGDDDAAGGNKRKRPLEQSSGDALNRIKSRRKATMKKPTSLAEIRQSVSFLLDGPEAAQNQESTLPPPSEHRGTENRDEEDELHTPDTTVRHDTSGPQGNNNSPTTHTDATATTNTVGPADTFNNPRRRPGAAVVDRLSLRRAASSNAKSAATASKLAFYAKSDPNGGASSFKGPPPLLSRRSTTSSTSSSSLGANDSGGGGGAGAGKAEVPSGTGLGGNKKAAAVNYYAAARDKVRGMELKKKTEQRRKRRLGLGADALRENGERLKGLLGAGESGQWD